MKTTIKTDLTTSEAKEIFVITEREIRTIRTMINGINTQIDALDEFMNAMGLDRWMSNSPRSIAACDFKITKDD